MKKGLCIIVALLVAAFVFGACTPESPDETATTSPATQPAAVEETIELKFSSPYMGPDAPTVYGNHLCDLVEQKTNGKVKVERFDSASLGAPTEHLGLVSSGAVDFVVMQPGYFPQDLPLNSQGSSYQMGNSEEALATVVKYRETPEVKAILEEEQRKNNIKILDYNVTGPSAMATKEPATCLGDLQGKKANVQVASHRPVWDAHGVISVNIQLGEVYEGLSRGIIDIGVGPMAACASMKWYEVSKSVLMFDIVMIDIPIVVNLERWDGFSADVQQAILDASHETMLWGVDYDAELLQKYLQAFESAGVDVVQLPDEDTLKFMQLSTKSARDEALANCDNLGVGDKVRVLFENWDEVYPEGIGDY